MSGIPISDLLVGALLLIGSFTVLLGSIGLNRFPDAYSRLHATGKGATVGLMAILLAGTIFFSLREGLNLKLALVIPFLFLTGPAGVFMLGKAAHRIGPNLSKQTIRDDWSAEAGTVKERG